MKEARRAELFRLGMVEVPGSVFQRGTPSGGEEDERPSGRVFVSELWIDKTEVTVDAYAVCVKEGGCAAPDTSGLYCSGDYANQNNWLHRAERGDHPVNCVSWEQAVAFCSWAGKRLPTEAEWEKAARGVDGRRYPWGEEEPEGSGKQLGNFADASLKQIASDVKVLSAYDDGHAYTSPVGSFPLGASPYGALDMSGNVWEWVSDWYADSYSGLTGRDPAGSSNGSKLVNRGGSFYSSGASSLRAANRDVNASVYVDSSLGFRCASSGSPRP